MLVKLTVKRISFSLQWPLETRGITRVMVHPVWTIVRFRLNIRWNGKTRQNVVGLTFGSTVIHLNIYYISFYHKTYLQFFFNKITWLVILLSNDFFMPMLFIGNKIVIHHSPTDNVSNSAIIGFDTTPGPDVSVMRNCTWSHSLLVFTICMSTSVPCSFFATVYFRNKLKFLLSFFPSNNRARIKTFPLNKINAETLSLMKLSRTEFLYSVEYIFSEKYSRIIKFRFAISISRVVNNELHFSSK